MSGTTTPDGLTDITSWLVNLRDWHDIRSALKAYPFPSDHQSILHPPAMNAGITIDYKQLWKQMWEGVPIEIKQMWEAEVVLQHEHVHFLHSISTQFLYRYSVDYTNLCMDILGSAAQGNNQLGDFQKEFTPLTDRLGLVSPKSGIRAIDVIEGAADLCAYRMLAWRPLQSHDMFLCYLNDHHHGQPEYRRAYEYASEIVGGALAFDIFAPACFVALQCGNPGDSLTLLLERVKSFEEVKEGIKRTLLRDLLYREPLAFLLVGTDIQQDACLPLAIRGALPQGRSIHLILQPYLEYIEKIAIATSLPVNDFFARPYKYMFKYFYNRDSIDDQEKEMADFVSNMFPPLVCSFSKRGRKHTKMGIGRRLGRDYWVNVLYLTACVGLVERIVFARDAEMICPHRECTVYNTELCNKYFMFPIDDYNECGFRNMLKVLKLERLLDCRNLYMN